MIMSLYQLSKLLYQLNRDERTRARFAADRLSILADYQLSEEERLAVTQSDIGLLYVLGVNGQILMHFAALCGIPWTEYIQRMREGVKQHGPVRAGLYAMTTGVDEKVAGV